MPSTTVPFPHFLIACTVAIVDSHNIIIIITTIIIPSITVELLKVEMMVKKMRSIDVKFRNNLIEDCCSGFSTVWLKKSILRSTSCMLYYVKWNSKLWLYLEISLLCFRFFSSLFSSFLFSSLHFSSFFFFSSLHHILFHLFPYLIYVYSLSVYRCLFVYLYAYLISFYIMHCFQLIYSATKIVHFLANCW